MQYIANAFSLGMVPSELLERVRFTPLAGGPTSLSGVISCVGHADTAAVLGVEMRRVSVTLQPGDSMFVAQLRGGRLPEGATTLPEGFGFDWVFVSIEVAA